MAEAAQIRTTENLLFTPSDTLYDLLSSIPRDDIDNLVSLCLELTVPLSRTGDVEWDTICQMQTGTKWEGWGVRGLDEVLEGGMWDGIGVLELAGAKRVAKSVSSPFVVPAKVAEARWKSVEDWLIMVLVVGFTCCVAKVECGSQSSV